MARRRQESERRGVAALEFALVAVPFLLLVLGLIEFGCLILTQHLVTNAARGGARRACVNTDVNQETVDANNTSPADIETEIRTALTGLLRQPEVQIFYVDDRNSDWTRYAYFQHRIAVEVRGQYEPLTPLFALIHSGSMDSIPVVIRSIVRSEGQ